MPNDQGPHGELNAKKKLIPANVSYRDVIGYTTDPRKPTRAVTVYTTMGHFTQDHDDKWNIGWDSCVGWECKFFGNVRDGSDDSSRGNRMAPDQYVQKLGNIADGYNRFNGLVWDLRKPSEGPGYHRREFWIRGRSRRYGSKSRSGAVRPARNDSPRPGTLQKSGDDTAELRPPGAS